MFATQGELLEIAAATLHIKWLQDIKVIVIG